MANTLINNPPALVAIEPLEFFRNKKGLSLILGNVPDETVAVQNTSESVNQIKNHMGWAQLLTHSDWSRVAKVPDGKKFATSSTRTDIFRGDGTSSVTIHNRKAYVLDSAGYIHVMLGNDSVNWRLDRYNSVSFPNGVPYYKGTGIQKTSDGWWYATVCKGFDGAHDDVTSGYFVVETADDAYKDLKGLNVVGEASQAKRICGTGKVQTTGTCCLFYNENHYDTITDVTFDAGDYYKCIDCKCYQCLEFARELNKDYAFTAFKGVAATGGVGERCESADLEDFPTNCGPCSCNIGTYKKYDTILNDINISDGSKAKENCRLAKYWEQEGDGIALMHVLGNVLSVNITEREISRNYWGRDKILSLEGPQISIGTTKYSIVTSTDGRGTEYFEGLRLISTGTYTSKPLISSFESEFKKICPKLNATHLFNIVMLPNFGELEELSELVGGTHVQLNVKVNLSDLTSDESGTLMDSFNVYALGVPTDKKNIPFFASTDDIKTSQRLTYKHNDIDVTHTGVLSKAQIFSQAKKTKSKTLKNTSVDNFSIIASNKPFESRFNTKTRLEVFAGGSEESAINISTSDGIKDQFGTKHKTTVSTQKEWSKPLSAKTGELIDVKNTKIMHVNSLDLNLNIPKFGELKDKVNSSPGFNNVTVQFVLTIGTT